MYEFRDLDKVDFKHRVVENEGTSFDWAGVQIF